MACRKSIASTVAAGEHTAFVQAVLDLKNSRPSIVPAAQAVGATSRYDDYVWMHLAAFSLIHLGPAFGPWHREVLRQFELDLREVSGNPNLCIPYWDYPTGRQPGDPDWPFDDTLLGGLGTGPGNAVETGPFAGATGDWDINVTDPGDPHTVLRRVSSTNPASLSLPDGPASNNALGASPYDSVPYNDNNFPTAAQAAASFRKSLEFFLHNGPHNWVGNEDPLFLDMMSASSPNDPIFFLHHAQIDRMWSTWQDRNPGLDHFLPLAGAVPGHNLNDVMDIMDASFFNFPVLATNAANIDLHMAGTWYDTDLPELTLATPSVDFQTIPAGLTTYFPVQFTVEGCRAFRLSITAVGGGFSVPPAQAYVDEPFQNDPSPRTVNVFLRCIAPADGSPITPGSVTIEASVVDSEGYLSGTAGSTHVFGSFSATLTATSIPRPTNAIAFVSDRSGSMKGTAGAGLSKFELLEEALTVATDLLDPSDSASLVFFDSTVMVPMPMSTIAGGGVSAALTDPAIQPQFGSTAIGEGLIAGAGQLDTYVPPAGGADPNLAILCLTDGNENVGPFVTDPPVNTAIAPYSTDVYAIGLGTEDNVSVPTLGSISKYMLVTGDNVAAHRRYLVTKYFVQILADIKSADVIVDPDGILYSGMTHEIKFDVCEADVEVDIIVLSAVAPYLEYEVVSPGGDVLSTSALGPNAKVVVKELDAVFHLLMPALPANPATSHAGRWTLRLKLDKRVEGKLREQMLTHAVQGRIRAADYSVVVQTRSNLSFHVGRASTQISAGEKITLVAWLSQYRQPLTSAKVTAYVTGPEGHASQYDLSVDSSDRFVAEIPAPSRGLYSCRVVATGLTMARLRFTRESIRTFVVGDSRPLQGQDSRNQTDVLCKVLPCLLQDPEILKWMKRTGIDAKRLRRCLESLCSPPMEGGAGTTKRRRGVTTMSTPKELTELIRKTLHEQARDPLEVAIPQPIESPVIDPALYDAPMFMPALAWNKDGEVVLATTNTKPPARGDRNIPVARLNHVSDAAASKLEEAGFRTAGDLLDRPQPLAGILGVSKSSVNKILAAARAGDTGDLPDNKSKRKKGQSK